MHFFLAVCSYANYDLLPTQSLLHTLPNENCPYDVTSRRPLVCHASIGPSDLVALVLDQVGDMSGYFKVLGSLPLELKLPWE